MRATVVIPTLNARDLLADALASLEAQTLRPEVVVVDNGSTDGTAELVAERFPSARLVRSERNLGFGAAINRGALGLDTDVLVLVNNDVVCEPHFVERLVAPFADPAVGMAAGVLLQAEAPGRIDSAGIELDATLRAWDHLWNEPVERLAGARDPAGPCGGAAAYRLDAFRALGGFDEVLFAYWEDADLALRFRIEGLECRLAPGARALHRHGQTFGAGSPVQRRLDAFGRAYVLAKYRVARRRPAARAQIAALDWPALAVHLLARRELGPLRARLRGTAAGLRAAPPRRTPFDLAAVPFRTALARQWRAFGLRLRGQLPAHFAERGAHAAPPPP